MQKKMPQTRITAANSAANDSAPSPQEEFDFQLMFLLRENMTKWKPVPDGKTCIYTMDTAMIGQLLTQDKEEIKASIARGLQKCGIDSEKITVLDVPDSELSKQKFHTNPLPVFYVIIDKNDLARLNYPSRGEGRQP